MPPRTTSSGKKVPKKGDKVKAHCAGDNMRACTMKVTTVKTVSNKRGQHKIIAIGKCNHCPGKCAKIIGNK